MKQELIAPCGMNCALCVSYQFKDLDLNAHGFSRRYCPGCIPRGKHCTFMSKHCEIVGKGQVRFCYECAKFPCQRLKDLDRRYQARYGMSMIDNLNCIKEKGMDAFLLEQEEKWKCHKCGGTICCHEHMCLNCHIDNLKAKKK